MAIVEELARFNHRRARISVSQQPANRRANRMFVAGSGRLSQTTASVSARCSQILSVRTGEQRARGCYLLTHDNSRINPV
jgi:hypothetical protein